MSVERAIGRYRDRQRQAVAAVLAAMDRQWRNIDPDFIVDSWQTLLPQATGMVSRAQLRAAEAGAAYVPQVIRAQGIRSRRAGEVNVRGLVGVASDGRPLETLLAGPAYQTVTRIGQGMAPNVALTQGRNRLAWLAGTQVLDAGRLAASVGMVSDRAVGGYRRQLTLPSCDRCVILAGAWYRWNQGFRRHPQCDCVHVPAVGPKSDVAGLETFDPQAYFDSLDIEEQDRRFTKAGAAAIRDGADMGQVVNARRGMRTTAGYRHTSSPTRLMPEQIYRDATSRDDAIRLLGRFGYLNS